jgi:glutamate-ammonia-ligase adenylyltransferase
LVKKRKPADLARDIAEMRARMAAERRADTPWRIKDWRGGLVDVEFLVQHAILASGDSALARPSTGEAVAALAKAGRLTKAEAETLAAALALYSGIQAMLRLTWPGELDPATAPEALKALLAKSASVVDFAALQSTLEDHGAKIRALFDKRLPTPQRSS